MATNRHAHMASKIAKKNEDTSGRSPTPTPRVPIPLDNPEELRQASKKATRRAVRSILFCPVSFACCFCTSIHGVLELMRSENTREFALAVVVGNAFDTFISSFASDVIYPAMAYMFALSRAVYDPAVASTLAVGPFAAGSGWLLKGGGLYEGANSTLDPFAPIPYASVADATTDGALFVNVASFVQSLISFILQLLNIYWFFGWCVPWARPHAPRPLPQCPHACLLHMNMHMMLRRAPSESCARSVAKTEIAEKFVQKTLAGTKDIALKGANVAGVNQLNPLAYLESTAQCNVDVEDSTAAPATTASAVEAGPTAASVASAASMTRSSTNGAADGGSAAMGNMKIPSGVLPLGGLMPNAKWVALVESASSVEGGMRQLHAADPMLFYLYGDQVRRALQYKLECLDGGAGRSSSEEPSPRGRKVRRHRTRTTNAEIVGHI